MGKAPLRICLLCKSDLIPLWLAEAVEKLVNAKALEISLMAITLGCSEPQETGLLARIIGICRTPKLWLFQVYSFITGIRRHERKTALTPTSVSHLCINTPRLLIRCTAVNGRIEVVEEDLCLLRGRNLDVVLCCGLAPVNLEDPDVAAQGVWYVEDARDPFIVDAEAGVWEFLGEYPILKMEIKRRLGGKYQPEVISRSFLPIYVRDGLWAIHGIRDMKLWTASAWLRTLMLRLYTAGPSILLEPIGSNKLDSTTEQNPQFPNNRQMAAVILKKIRRKCRQALGKKNPFDEWQVAFSLDDRTPIEALDSKLFLKLLPPRGFFWADPVPVKHAGAYFIFIEELPYANGKGHISVIQVDDKGAWKAPVKVLERPYHLSYPFVFQWNGNYYMMPETASNRTIELYKADPFPFQWTFEKVLLENIRAVDSTLLFHDDTWWMFCATMPYQELADDNFMELNIFYAKTPCGSWLPHPKNPVKSDARNSRPAGGVLVSNGKLLRPAQDCFMAYGHAISINAIEQLTTKQFVESEVARISPSKFDGAVRIHTIGRCEGLTVVDLAFKSRD